MPSYSADIGTWESGKCIPFRAKDDDAAITKAHKLVKSLKLSGDVVQIRRHFKGKKTITFFDFFNGKMPY